MIEERHLNQQTNWSKIIFNGEKKFNFDDPDVIYSYWRDLLKGKDVFFTFRFGLLFPQELSL